jgi:hypothetical protein
MEYSITNVLIIVLSLIHLYQNMNHTIIYDLYHLKNTFLQHLSTTFFHSNLIHLFQNCFTIHNLRFIEYDIGKFDSNEFYIMVFIK